MRSPRPRESRDVVCSSRLAARFLPQIVTVLPDSHQEEEASLSPYAMTTVKSEIYFRATETADYIRGHLSQSLKQPKVGIVCGSGLSGLADAVRGDREKIEISYSAIPNFPESTGAKFQRRSFG